MMKMMMMMMILQTPHKFSIDFLQAGDDTMCINEAYVRGTAAGLPQDTGYRHRYFSSLLLLITHRD